MNLLGEPLRMEPSAKSRNGGDLAEDEHVMSEVHLGCPTALSGPHTSLFTFSLASVTHSLIVSLSLLPFLVPLQSTEC